MMIELCVETELCVVADHGTLVADVITVID